MTPALLVMAKRPRPGQAKTRLCPPLTNQEAADLYECFLRDTLDLARSWPGARRFIAYDPAGERAYFADLAPDFGLVPQLGETLGQRLDNVLTGCLRNGFAPVVAICSDSPALPVANLDQAFTLLARPDVDVVFGPCSDGGYYLVGWKRPHPRLVREVQMSTPRVLRDSLSIAQQEGARVALLPPWYDVDTESELNRLRQDLQNSSLGAAHTRAFLSGKGW